MSVPSEPVLGSYSGTIRPLCESSSITLYWDPPLSNGGFPIQSYLISCMQGPDSQTYIVSPSIRYHTINGLSNCINYTYMIAGSNSQGLGPFSIYRTVQPGRPPNEVQNVYISTMNGLQGQSVFIQWDAPQEQDDIPQPQWYVITPAATNGNDPIFSLEAQGRISLDGWDSRYVYDTLRLSTTAYSFLVQAVNDPGYSPNRSQTSTVGNVFSTMPIFWLEASNYNPTNGIWSDVSPNQSFFTAGSPSGIQKFDSYLSLDGSSLAFFTCTQNSMKKNFSTFTFSSWIRLQSTYTTTTDRGIFGEINTGIATPQFQIRTRGPSGVTANSPSFWYSEFYSASAWRSTIQYVNFVRDAWTHITVTVSTNFVDKTTIVTYINGVQNGVTNFSNAATNPQKDGFALARSIIGPTTTTKCDIGQTVFFDSVLTSTNILQIYNLRNGIQYSTPSYTSTQNQLAWFDPTLYTSGTWQNRAIPGSYDALVFYGSATKSASYALTFSNTAFRIPGGFGGTLSSFTISAWFNPSVTFTGFSTSIFADESDGTRMNFAVGLGWRGPVNTLTNSINGLLLNSTWQYGPAYLGATQRWQNLTYTCSNNGTNTTIFTYVNGRIYDFSYTFPNFLPATPGTGIRIGMCWEGDNSVSTRMFRGDIGSILVYNTVLSEKDILQNYAVEANLYR